MTSTGTQFGAISIFHGFVVFNPRFFVLPSLPTLLAGRTRSHEKGGHMNLMNLG